MLCIELNNDANKLYIPKHLPCPTIYNLYNQNIMTRIRNFSHTLPFILCSFMVVQGNSQNFWNDKVCKLFGKLNIDDAPSECYSPRG